MAVITPWRSVTDIVIAMGVQTDSKRQRDEGHPKIATLLNQIFRRGFPVNESSACDPTDVSRLANGCFELRRDDGDLIVVLRDIECLRWRSRRNEEGEPDAIKHTCSNHGTLSQAGTRHSLAIYHGQHGLAPLPENRWFFRSRGKGMSM